MAYKVAGIDIHKRMLMVVVATAADHVVDPIGEALEFVSRRFGTGASERTHLVAWLREQGVAEVVMESTAQYWKPVWLDLEPHFAKLHLAQAQSNGARVESTFRAPKGRKDDFRDAKRLTRRLLAGELSLMVQELKAHCFVPGPEQRTWRSMTRGKLHLTQDRVRLQNQIEALLEEARIKLSSVVSDLLGVSGRRILAALAKGETDPGVQELKAHFKLAELADERLKCSKEDLADALRGSPEPVHLKLLEMYLKRLTLLDEQIETLNQMMATALKKHEDAVMRLAQVPGLGVDSAQQIIAEECAFNSCAMGVDAESFPSAGEFASWIGVCPGENESAEENHSARSPKGNRFMRRILDQAANAAVKKKGSHFQSIFLRLVPRLKYAGAVWAVAHRIARVVWLILHKGVTYIEQGEESNPTAKKRRAQKLIKAFKKLGYGVTLTPINPQLAPQPEG